MVAVAAVTVIPTTALNQDSLEAPVAAAALI
jgi:hypothetical protein